MKDRPPLPRLVVIGLVAAAVVMAASQSFRGDAPAIVFVGARAYPSPTETAIDDAVVVVREGRIADVGRASGYRPPRGATVIDSTGLILTAGFWNTHVHFTGPEWGEAPPAALTEALRRTLVRHGFTTVLDAGSSSTITSALRRRIDEGQVIGPRILTTGGIVFPGGGAPGAAGGGTFGPSEQGRSEVATPEEGAALAGRLLDAGADGLKVYVATWWNDPPARMTAPTVRAIAEEAHRRGKPLVAHPSDVEGIETALAGGVDVLAHTTPPAGSWSEALVARMREHRIALIPTLMLWRAGIVHEGVPEAEARAIQQVAVGQLRAYVEAGGEILFGTDVGYMQDDDPLEEYELMASAGMDFRQILASLTTAPAARFGEADLSGRIAPGHSADLVFLRGDPAIDPRAFAQVVRVVRDGQIVFTRAR